MTRKRYEEKFGDEKDILYLDYDGGNKTKHIYKNSLNYNWKGWILLCKLYVNKIDFQNKA